MTRKMLPFDQVLKQLRLVTDQQLEEALQMSENSRLFLDEVLVELGYITQDDVNKAVDFRVKEYLRPLFIEIADLMNGHSVERGGKPTYDLMSDAIYWPDELPEIKHCKPVEAFHALRWVLRYRTSLILGSPEDKREIAWQFAKSSFPQWIGFTANRCEENEELAEIYEELSAASNNFDEW